MALHVVDITQIQYPADYFDILICSHVLGHIPDEAKAIQELKRVVKANGFALILTVIDSSKEITFENKDIISPKERLINYGEADLSRLHGLDFKQRLEKQGFIVERIDYRKNIEPDLRELYRLGDGKRELIFKCWK
jgi:SAM-dependent methyltransferase